MLIKELSLIGNKVLVKTKPKEDRIKDIFLPTEVIKKRTVGTILVCSDEVSVLSVGMDVCYPEFAGVEVSNDGEEYRVLETTEIYFILTDQGSIITLNNYIVVVPEKVEDKFRGVVKIATDAKDVDTKGTITYRSPTSHPKLLEGKTIIYSKFAGFKVKFNNQELLVLQEEDVLVLI